MAHYAFLDENNIVTEVIVGQDEGDSDWEQYYGQFRGQVCKRTSYNTRGGIHSDGGKPYRKNYAGIGCKYDASRDAFIPPRPFKSWMLDEKTCLWEAPVAYPADDGRFTWDEAAGRWEPARSKQAQ